MRGDVAQARNAVDDVAGQVETVQIVEHGHIERRGGGAFFLIAADVQIVVIGAAVGQAVDQPGIAVEGEDDGFVGGEDGIEIARRRARADVRWRAASVIRSTTLTTRIFRSGRCACAADPRRPEFRAWERRRSRP